MDSHRNSIDRREKEVSTWITLQLNFSVWALRRRTEVWHHFVTGALWRNPKVCRGNAVAADVRQSARNSLSRLKNSPQAAEILYQEWSNENSLSGASSCSLEFHTRGWLPGGALLNITFKRCESRLQWHHQHNYVSVSLQVHSVNKLTSPKALLD